MTGAGEAVLFWIAATIMVLGSLGLIFARRAVYAALSMALVMVMLGIVFIAQGAEFLGIIHVFVYTGAVLMLFVFVIMLVGVDLSESMVETLKGHRLVALLIAVGLAALLLGAVGSAVFGPAPPIATMNAEGNVSGLATLIFGRYMWVFQLIGVLLVIASMAIIVLAHRERLLPRLTQTELSQQRVRDNRYVAGLPPPGVYARHNAVDTPALLPDGTPTELSVSRVLAAREQLEVPTRYTEGEDELVREIEEGRER